MAQVNRKLPLQVFCPSTVFHHDVGDRVRAEACKKTTPRQVTAREEEWKNSTYTNCELKWEDKGKIQNIKVVTVRGKMHDLWSILIKKNQRSLQVSTILCAVYFQVLFNFHWADLLSQLLLQSGLGTFIYWRRREVRRAGESEEEETEESSLGKHALKKEIMQSHFPKKKIKKKEIILGIKRLFRPNWLKQDDPS